MRKINHLGKEVVTMGIGACVAVVAAIVQTTEYEFDSGLESFDTDWKNRLTEQLENMIRDRDDEYMHFLELDGDNGTQNFTIRKLGNEVYIEESYYTPRAENVFVLSQDDIEIQLKEVEDVK